MYTLSSGCLLSSNARSASRGPHHSPVLWQLQPPQQAFAPCCHSRSDTVQWQETPASCGVRQQPCPAQLRDGRGGCPGLSCCSADSADLTALTSMRMQCHDGQQQQPCKLQRARQQPARPAQPGNGHGGLAHPARGHTSHPRRSARLRAARTGMTLSSPFCPGW